MRHPGESLERNRNSSLPFFVVIDSVGNVQHALDNSGIMEAYYQSCPSKVKRSFDVIYLTYSLQ